MAAKAVQISIDDELLRRIDARPEAKRRGRSAFLREAVLFYLKARERADLDERIRKAYAGRAGELAAEVEGLPEAQTWPDE